jgi:hypothetical protein
MLCASLLLLLACPDEQAIEVLLVEPIDAPVQPLPVVTSSAATTSTVAKPSEPSPGAPDTAPLEIPRRRQATKVRDGMLALRKQLADDLGALTARIAALDAQQKVTGPRSEQRAIGEALRKARGQTSELVSIRERCEAAFDGDEWHEIEDVWQAAESAAAQRDRVGAEEGYSRLIALVDGYRAHCQPLAPMPRSK